MSITAIAASGATALTALITVGDKILETSEKGLDLAKRGQAKAHEITKDAMTLQAELDKYFKGSSLISASNPTRLEPITVVDSTLVGKDFMPDVMSFTVDLFSAFFLQTLGLVTAKVNDVNVVRQLDQLNPSRALSNIIHYSKESLESHTIETLYHLPTTLSDVGVERFNVGLEHRRATNPFSGVGGGNNSKAKVDDEKKGEFDPKRDKVVSLPIASSDSLRDLRESASLAVGKLLEVTMGEGELKVSLPVAVRPMIRVADYDIIPAIFVSTKTRTMKENYHAWRSGELKFWRDIVFARAALVERRKLHLNDAEGIREEITKRIANSRLMTALTNQPSYAQLSNMLIISEPTARQLEVSMRGKLDDFRTRERLFESSGMMMILVVDEFHDQVDIYYHSLSTKTERSLSDFKRRGRDSGADINMIMQALNQFSAPSF